MLYVFQMDIGQMLTFDMSLLMDTVARLQTEIYKSTGISVDQQILLLSGGQSLKADQKVMAYGAGADTNPVFLFSKLAIESQEPPVIRSFMTSKDALIALKERVNDAMKLRPSFDTVNLRAKLAIQIRESANNIYSYCKNEFHEQHLQHQGWAAVIANLEEIADALQKTEIKFTKVFHSFLTSKEINLKHLEGFGEVLDLIGRIPLLDSLKDSSEDDSKFVDSKYKGSDRSLVGSLHTVPKTLLEWICSQAQGQGIDCLHQKCEDDLKMFNEGMFDSYDKQVHDLLSAVRMDPNQMKELVGIERRLSELEKRLNEAKRLAATQNDLAQGFIKHQSKLGSLPDVASILPDLCETHKQQLFQMLDCQQRIVALQNNFRNSKQEMSRNIHQRLSWVMHVETKIAKMDSELIFHMKTLKVLECNLDLLGQIKISPNVYADLVIETARRRKFSDKFSEWAAALEDGCNNLYVTETERRKAFSEKNGDHFLVHTMFKGFEDKPQNTTTKVPRLLDANLPEITVEEISWLKSSVPELEESLSFVEPPDHLPSDILCTYSSEKMSLNAHIASPVQVSQSHTSPCIVTATEGPATPFTVLESKNSHRALPTVSAAATTTTTTTTTTKRDVAIETQIKKLVDKSSQRDDTHSNSMKETQTSVTLTAQENKGVGTADEAEADSYKQVGGGVGGKPRSATDSSSPLSSTEFATADFYFEESMPSPMVESSADKKVDDPTKAVGKEDFHRRLKEKELLVEELNGLLREKEEETAKLHDELLTLKGERSEENLEFFSLIGPLDEVDSDAKEASICSPLVASKEVESTWCQTESRSSVDDRVTDLEQKLEKLTVDLDQSQLSLMKAEGHLQLVQEQEQTVQRESKCLIAQLKEEIGERDRLINETKGDLDFKDAEVVKLKGTLDASSKKEVQLQNDVDSQKDALTAVQSKLKELASISGQTIPALREDLDIMKGMVKDYVGRCKEFKSSAMVSVQQEFLSFSTAVSAIEQERRSLKTEAGQLEEDLKNIRGENEVEINDLKSQIESVNAQLVKQEEMFAVKYADQKNDFDCALQDAETKHALEMELEVDKCKAELKERIEDWEQKYDYEKEAKGTLVKDLEAARKDFENEKEELKTLHASEMKELELKYKDTNEQCVSDFQDKLDQYKQQVQAVEIEASATATFLNGEKEKHLECLRQELVKEHDDHIAEMTHSHKDQVQTFTDTIEDLQLNHAYKLAELKKSFDQERDLIQSELKSYKDNERINSFTQTERELLAEVISLTSSASDGMDELPSPKTPEDTPDVGAKPKSEEKSSFQQLAEAQDTIKSMDERMKMFTTENAELKERLRCLEEGPLSQAAGEASLDQSQFHSLMQMSATGKSFILMEKESQAEQADTDEMKLKDQKIAHLEKHIMEMSVTSGGRTPSPDKISFRGCDIGDLVLLCLDEKHDQYVVFTVGTNLHFLHSESLECLGLKSVAEPSNKKPWILAKVMDKEYCLAKKPNNRFRVPQGTCFYRVKCQPWRCEVDLTKHKDLDTVRQRTKSESGNGAKAKKVEKK